MAAEFQKSRQYLPNFRRALQHFIRNSGQIGDSGGKPPSGRHKGLKSIQYLSVFHNGRANLNDPVGLGRQAGGLQIKGHIFPVQRHILLTVYHNAVVQIVYKISLAAVENFDLLVRARHLGGGGVEGVGEGLRHAVVGNGDGLMPPLGRLLHRRRRIRQCVHGGHGGMQMQLHPFLRRRVLTLRAGHLHDGVGLQHHLVVKAVDGHAPLNTQIAAGLVFLGIGLMHPFNDALGLCSLHKLIDPHGACVIGDKKGHHTGVALGQLSVADGEDLSLHADLVHIQRQLFHGHGLVPEHFAENQFLRLVVAGLGRCGFDLRRGSMLHGLTAHTAGLLKQGFPLQFMACVRLHRHLQPKMLRQIALCRMQMRPQLLQPIALQMQVHSLPFPLPAAARQGGQRRGIFIGNALVQIGQRRLRELVCGKGRLQPHPAQRVASGNGLLRLPELF